MASPSLYSIGIGQPQYLCLLTPQSLSLYWFKIFALPSDANVFETFSNASSGINPSKSFEFTRGPEPENGKSSSEFMTLVIGILYLLAKSKSLSSWPGTPIIAPVP